MLSFVPPLYQKDGKALIKLGLENKINELKL
jgi:hypothetical protein